MANKRSGHALVGGVCKLNNAAGYLGAALLLVLMCTTILEILLRAIGWQVAGSVELIGWLTAVTVALALGPTQQEGGHIAVTMLSDLLPKKVSYLMQFS